MSLLACPAHNPVLDLLSLVLHAQWILPAAGLLLGSPALVTQGASARLGRVTPRR